MHVIHAVVDELWSEDEPWQSHYEVTIMVGSHEVVRLRSTDSVERRYPSDDEAIIADTLRKYFNGDLSAV